MAHKILFQGKSNEANAPTQFQYALDPAYKERIGVTLLESACASKLLLPSRSVFFASAVPLERNRSVRRISPALLLLRHTGRYVH